MVEDTGFRAEKRKGFEGKINIFDNVDHAESYPVGTEISTGADRRRRRNTCRRKIIFFFENFEKILHPATTIHVYNKRFHYPSTSSTPRIIPRIFRPLASAERVIHLSPSGVSWIAPFPKTSSYSGGEYSSAGHSSIRQSRHNGRTFRHKKGFRSLEKKTFPRRRRPNDGV